MVMSAEEFHDEHKAELADKLAAHLSKRMESIVEIDRAIDTINRPGGDFERLSQEGTLEKMAENVRGIMDSGATFGKACRKLMEEVMDKIVRESIERQKEEDYDVENALLRWRRGAKTLLVCSQLRKKTSRTPRVYSNG